MLDLKRRDFIALGGSALLLAVKARRARAQQPAMPVIGLLHSAALDAVPDQLRGFRQGLREAGYVEGDNVALDYRWTENQIDQLAALATELVRGQVAVLAAAGHDPAFAAKAATKTIPIVFISGEDPVRLGLVASLARPGGNATGVNFLASELAPKRLQVLRDLLPAAARIALLVNPGNATITESTIRDVQKAAPTLGLQIQILNASTIGEIDAAFATLARERPDALFVAPDTFFTSRRVQFATLTARDRIPAAYAVREFVTAGGLMSYGTNVADMFHQVGVYTGHILKGAKPADLPVLQLIKFELVINLQTARALGIEVPPGVLSIADEVIE